MSDTHVVTVEDRFGSSVRLFGSEMGLWFVTDGEDGHSEPLALFDRAAAAALSVGLRDWLASGVAG